MVTFMLALLAVALTAGAEAPPPTPSAKPPALFGYRLGEHYVLKPGARLEPYEQVYQRVIVPRTTVSLAGVQWPLQITLQVTLQTNTIVAVWAQIPVTSTAAAQQVRDALVADWKAQYGEDSISYLADRRTAHFYYTVAFHEAGIVMELGPDDTRPDYVALNVSATDGRQQGYAQLAAREAAQRPRPSTAASTPAEPDRYCATIGQLAFRIATARFKEKLSPTAFLARDFPEQTEQDPGYQTTRHLVGAIYEAPSFLTPEHIQNTVEAKCIQDPSRFVFGLSYRSW